MMKRFVLVVATLAIAPSLDAAGQPATEAPAPATGSAASGSTARKIPPASAGSSAPTSATGSSAPGSAAAPSAGSAPPAVPPASTPPTAPPTTTSTTPSSDEPPMTGSAEAMRKTCAAAMNADPQFADAIIKTAERKARDKVNLDQIDKDLCKVKFHTDAQEVIAKNEKHVILAYAAMWILAALFVVYLWRRQQHLTAEILQLRKELEAAEKEASK
jgi:hypothetical protein